MSEETKMYVSREPDGFFTLRQERYRAQLLAGNEHKNDVCAVARSAEELQSMCAKYWPDVDYTAAKPAK